MPRQPYLSVIVPVQKTDVGVKEVLKSICNSAMARDSYELIVVDDQSTEESASLAARYADKVMRLSGTPAGPAYARNRGVEIACGSVVAFVNADVAVNPGTLPAMLATLAKRPEIDAVSASHSETCGPQNFASRYWNLLLRYGEQPHGGRHAHFAAGCGAVRRDVLVSAGMYDEWRFVTAGGENFDLAHRLIGAGHGVVLDTNIKVTHLKRWTVRSVCQEVWRRSTLLARSLGYQQTRTTIPGEVVFTLSRALSHAVAVFGTLTLAAAFLPEPPALAAGGIAFGALLLTNLPVHRFYAKGAGLGFAILAAPMHVFVQLVAGVALCNGWILRDMFGDVVPDVTTQAYSEVGLEMWPPVRRRL